MFHTLTSKKFTLFLLGALALVLIPATVSKYPLFISAGRLLLAVLAINLSLCTVKHWRRLSGSVILIHTGILIILIGSLVSQAGFIATINIYEGDTSDTAFRWDRQEEIPLGFTLMVKKINSDYYPVPVRVGVLVDGKPSKLYELKTGESFEHEGFHIEILDFDLLTPRTPRGGIELNHLPTPAGIQSDTPLSGTKLSPVLHFAITGADGVRIARTATQEIPSSQAGITLQLVAFQTPVVKRRWVDLTLIPATAPSVSGLVEVNHPLQWQGLRFYHTATNVDMNNQAYAGIQIVKDQGVPLVYLGFITVCLGNGMLLFRKVNGSRHARHGSDLKGNVGG